jgi:hypothetical protein
MEASEAGIREIRFTDASGGTMPDSKLSHTGAGDDLADRATATWLTLLACQSFADDDVAPTLKKAMRCLDDVAGIALALPVDERSPWLREMGDIDELAQDIFEHLVREHADEGS